MLQTILYNLTLILFMIYFYKKTKNGLHMLQLESYKNERYLKWVKQNKNINVTELILLIIPNVLFIFQKNIIGLILINITYIVLIILLNIPEAKKEFVLTARIKRMYATYIVLILAITVLLNIYPYMVLSVISIITVISYHLVMLINTINYPVEKAIQKKFYNKAKNKLEQMPNLIKIGVTGSYGKTSTKYIISTILSAKYQVLMTPESYNTTMGVVRTINEKLDATHQIFVCEMGAKNIGDIKEICDLVKPKYGILTAIGPQHLETFKTIENVKKTKLELINALPEEGIAFINNEDENIKTANINKKNIKYGISTEADYYAQNIKINEYGSEFEIITRAKEKIEIKTKLLGKLNIINIVGAVAIAKELGLNNEEIKAGIRFIKPVSHRLQLKTNINGSIIIDDAYNSNIKGAQMALEVLGNFENRKKILITPGIVDLGENSEEYNKLLGKMATKSADYIILVGKKQADLIIKGIEEENYSKEKIFIADNLKQAIEQMNKIMDKTSVTLFENDLPDNYL